MVSKHPHISVPRESLAKRTSLTQSSVGGDGDVLTQEQWVDFSNSNLNFLLSAAWGIAALVCWGFTLAVIITLVWYPSPGTAGVPAKMIYVVLLGAFTSSMAYQFFDKTQNGVVKTDDGWK